MKAFTMLQQCVGCLKFRLSTQEGRVKWTPRPKWVPSVTAFLVCNAVKATVAVFTDPPGDTIQRRICLFGANAKR